MSCDDIITSLGIGALKSLKCVFGVCLRTLQQYSFLSTRLCHPASLAAVSAASPRGDSGRQARSRAKGLQTPRTGAGAGLWGACVPH